MERKGDIEVDTLIWTAIAAAVLVLMIIIYIILTGKASGLLEYIRNLLRFGQ